MVRRKNASADGGINLGLMITPMLDLAFQLLAFFVMTYRPPLSEAAVDGTLLPAAPGQSATQGKSAGWHIIVRARAESADSSEPRAIYLKKPKDLGPQLIATIAEPVEGRGDFASALESLARELKKSAAIPGARELPMRLEADRSLGYGYFIAVQDVVNASGFKSIEFRPLTDSR